MRDDFNKILDTTPTISDDSKESKEDEPTVIVTITSP